MINFIKEAINRFLARNSKFAKWLQYIAGAALIVTGLPDLLIFFGVSADSLPEWWIAIQSKGIQIAAFVLGFLAQFDVHPNLIKAQVGFKATTIKKLLPFSE